MKKCIKARPHDVKQVVALGTDMVEIHASSEDLDKEIDGQYDNIQLVVHLPEYDGKELMDAASLDEKKRLHAVKFYDKCLGSVRRWQKHFRGTPKAILHPGGWSSEPMDNWYKDKLYKNLENTLTELKTTGVDFLIENMPPQPWFYGGQWFCNFFMHPREILRFCGSVGRGLCLDICHAYLWCNYMESKDDVLSYISAVRPSTAHIHISDAKGVDDEGLQIDEGDMPIQDIVKKISPWTVGVCPEIWLGHKDNYKGFMTAFERMAKYNGGTH